jgi:hypothetical protein
MCVGIYTHYAHCDQAYLAVRLAGLLRGLGEPCDIYSDNSPGKLRLSFDHSVLFRGNCKFTDWAKNRSAIIWTHAPRVEQVNYAARRGIKTIIVPMWQELVPPFKKTLKRADHIVAMSNECRDLFVDVYRLNRVELIPFDAGLPITRKSQPLDFRHIRLFLPWFDRNARCATRIFIGALGYILERMEEPHLTVAVSSSRFGPAVARYFTRLGKRVGGRVTLVRNVPLIKRFNLYTNADLTLWPAECDNYGYCALSSLAAGTPLLSLAVPPQTEFLYPDVNATLVKTKIDYDDNGVPHAVADYGRYAAALQELIADPRHISTMQKKVSYNLQARRDVFEASWRKLLNL